MKKILLIIAGFIVLNVSAQSIAIKPFVISPNCYGSKDGSIQLYVDGGIAPYTFSWNNDLPANPAQTFLGGGTYEVTVTDNANNSATASIEVLEPAQINVSVSVKDVTGKNGNNGEVKLEVTGGTPGYSFQWNNESTDQDLWDIPAGSYSVVVTDAAGCTATASAKIYQTVQLFASAIDGNYLLQSTPATSEFKSKEVTPVANNTETSSNVIVYPNPASNVINVTGADNESEITLINMNGQIVSQQKSANAVTQINVASVANGNYVMLVKNGNESVSKIVSVAR